MDSGLLPRLPAAVSLSAHGPFTESVNDPKARHFGSDFDDNSSVVSGSVTSMASIGKSAACAECKQPEDPPAKIFVRCPKCRKIWHQCCLENCPKIPGPNWACGSCCSQMEASTSDRKRRYRSSTSNPASTPANPTRTATKPSIEGKLGPDARVQGETRTSNTVITENSPTSGISAPNKSFAKKVCGIPGCPTVLFNLSSSGGTLCQRHKIEQQHAKAVAARAQPSVSAPSASRRQIDKRGLHHMRPADKEVLKEKEARDRENLKRKRPDISRGNSAYSLEEMRPKSSGSNRPAIGPSALTQASSPATRRPSTGESQTLRKASLTSQTNTDSLSRAHKTQFTSNVRTSQSSESSAKIANSRNIQTLGSARDIPLLAAHYSPENEPRPRQIPPPYENSWDPSEPNNRQESNMPQQRVTRSPSPGQPEKTFRITSSAEMDSGNRLPIANSTDQISTEDTHLAGDSHTSCLTREQVSEDTHMADGIDNNTHVDELQTTYSTKPVVQPDVEQLHTDSDINTDRQPPPHSPTMDDASPDSQLSRELAAVTGGSSRDASVPDITGPHVDPEAALKALNDGWVTGNRPPTVLEQKLVRGDFDEDALDFMLARQRARDYSEPPTMEQLEAQNWAHIDPRVVWPEEPYTDEQAALKIQEIEARGGRKAQFGKVFTAQNLKEKADKGWEIHQWQDKYKEDDKFRESGKHLEALFGIEGVDNFVPSTQNGRLVMVERDEPDDEPRGPGRRRKKNKPRIYPVFGIPNNV